MENTKIKNLTPTPVDASASIKEYKTKIKLDLDVHRAELKSSRRHSYSYKSESMQTFQPKKLTPQQQRDLQVIKRCLELPDGKKMKCLQDYLNLQPKIKPSV